MLPHNPLDGCALALHHLTVIVEIRAIGEQRTQLSADGHGNAGKEVDLRYPALLLSDKKPKKTKSRSSIIGEFKKVLPLLKESTLAKILIMLTLLPNVVIPIMNYQFNFAIDQTFATEGGMIKFFGYFRGILNVISFIILLFVGRLFGRWGLPVALMFHPINYIIAFLAFLFRFDIFSAIGQSLEYS